MGLESDSTDLKLTELIKEVRLSDGESEIVKGAISSVINAILSIPDQEVGSDAASGFVRDLSVKQDKVRLTFRRPMNAHVAGSYSFGAVVKPDISADILVQMPKECFHEKDYLNYRYHAKRCLYLCVIEKYLKSEPSICNVQWSTFSGEGRKPVLLVYPATGLPEASFSLRIIPTASAVFNVSKLNLSRNNIRSFSQGGITQPTPNYNTSMLEDMFLEENSEFVRKVFLESRSLVEALILLKVWARQRRTVYTHDCINGYLLSVLVACLTAQSAGNIVSKSMTARQIFRVIIKYIGTSNAWEKGLFLHPPRQYNISKEDVNQQKKFPILLFDVSGHLNLMFRMTRAAFLELKDEAVSTLNCLEKHKDDGFEEIFMTKVDFASKFDSCLRINMKENSRVLGLGFCMDEERWRVCERDIHLLLSQGLTDRSKLVRVVWRNSPSNWNIHDGFMKFGEEPVLVGVLLSSQEKSFRIVDIGPSAENKDEVIKFRKFWGEKAELRRFKDGNIAESTVWECDPWERHAIIKRIVEYVLHRHFKLASQDLFHSVDQLDFCLHLNGKDPVSHSGKLMEAFETLSKRLRLLDDIPLKVSTVQPLDPAFRHASVFPPLPHPLVHEKLSIKSTESIALTCIPSMDVLIQLEGSGNWPLDPVAIERTKSAFLLRIGKSLEERWGMICTASEEEVNVHTSGFSFSLKILHERALSTLTSLAMSGKGKSIHPSIDKELFMKSQHSSMINGLHGRFPMYGSVVRLAKRWVSAHLFSSYFAEEVIELVVAHLFLRHFPFHAPCSRITGFLRFLRLLANFDWAYSPLVVDINNDLTSEDEKDIYENFLSCRKMEEKNEGEMDVAMYIATSYDKQSQAWTKFSPSKLVLKRIASYARSSADLLTGIITDGAPNEYTWECVFRTPLTNYDAVILLHPNKLPQPQHLLFPSQQPKGKLVTWGKPSKDFNCYLPLKGGTKSLMEARDKILVNFDPTRYFLRDLQSEFHDTFKLWYDKIGGDAIGITWEKNNSKKRRRDEEEEIKMDPLGILEEVGQIGKGFVKSVHLLKAPKLGQNGRFPK
ncbi:nucleolar protein isoform X1 [Carex rostrata]